jgi:hypothetical protein
MNTKDWTAIFTPDAKTAEIYSVYRRSADVYERANAAMGKTKKYETSMSSAANVTIKKK